MLQCRNKSGSRRLNRNLFIVPTLGSGVVDISVRLRLLVVAIKDKMGSK
jgi:hypothetical protein